jgi:pantetheine-phosphate adenylyltransferase
MAIGFYAGSFDPFTNGHLHVVKKAAQLFEFVYIGIGINPDKTRRYDKEDMKNVIEKVIIREELSNVKVLTYTGITTDKAHRLDCGFLIRGLRDGMDYAEEEKNASINDNILGLDTIYIRAGKLGNISSSLVVFLHKNGKDVLDLVPEEVYDYIMTH